MHLHGIEGIRFLLLYDLSIAEVLNVVDELFTLGDKFFLSLALKFLAHVIPKRL